MREVFGAGYERLIQGVYGEKPELMYVLASQSLRQGGWIKEAAQAADRAFAMSPADASVLQEKKTIDAVSGRIPA